MSFLLGRATVPGDGGSSIKTCVDSASTATYMHTCTYMYTYVHQHRSLWKSTLCVSFLIITAGVAFSHARVCPFIGIPETLTVWTETTSSQIRLLNSQPGRDGRRAFGDDDVTRVEPPGWTFTNRARLCSQPSTPEDAGRSWRSATQKETHTRDRIILCLRCGLPVSRTLRTKRLRLKPQSAASLPAEASTGTAAAPVIIICGDSKEKGALRCCTLGPGELHCLSDGRDP